MEDSIFAIALSTVSSPVIHGVWDRISCLGPAEIYRLLDSSGSRPETQDYLREKYPSDPLAAAELILKTARELNVRTIHYWQADYPRMLAETARPPLALYALGDFRFADSVAVVGSRRADPRSRLIARRICGRLAAEGYAVVSGMAMGIDRESHEAALDSSGSTVGVLANGIDITYPLSNRDLYRRILLTPGSGLVSEYPPGTFTRKWTFVRRNRIISGLCLGTVVVKAGSRSGALITAGYALEQNRELFACTGYSLDPDYEGCIRLIQKGAYAVATADDIVSELRAPSFRRATGAFGSGSRRALRPESSPCLPFENDDPAAMKILSLLKQGQRDVDDLARMSGFPVNIVNEALIVLELSGKIVKNGSTVAAV